MRAGDNIRLRADGRYEARYIKERDAMGHAIYASCYGHTYDEALNKRNEIVGEKYSIRRMNLLILGAGVLGKEVLELAESLRVFNKIDFLEDINTNPDAIGKCSNVADYKDEYPLAIPAIGDSIIRKRWFNDIVSKGFIVPTLIHPNANVARHVDLGDGTVICAGANVGLNVKTGFSCIISSGATINRGMVLPNWTLIDSGDIVI